jgi:hypothetical protein
MPQVRESSDCVTDSIRASMGDVVFDVNVRRRE